ncbi:hypothetical protein VOLCADRAFT_77804 [Volvox carteri f. nagariensis]|uniref:Tubby C-terminal domain-containing protein n=1 Tax=Volvox carteri f. nagariensis TaxID=3068 RepID=D8UHI1_VOLCA|nr:uncharacterized protein VOLCADRAFT_77804 [Volvox carteri f. nagariensis]EFJ40830.1 hypothetical protein VOLCADRAFT_77804 [Volvox carteri f. nagariensis]|eukprot:XP_002958099.1 hypothetical protein VOLCADRAFT_77804 [Volvox carteri f. nagariensis]
MDSDSDDERAAGYVPVLAATMSMAARGVSSPQRPESASVLRDGVSLYTNELFTDGDVLAEGPTVASPNGTAAPGRRGPSLAAKRQERLQAGATYTPNSLHKNPSLRAPPPVTSKSLTDSPSFRPSPLSQTGGSGTDAVSTAGSSQGGIGLIHGLRPSYDPNDEASSTAQEKQIAVAPRNGLQFDLNDKPAFLMMPGPKNGPVQCVIVRDRGSVKMYPRYSLYLEEGRRFLLSARKRKKQTTSNYVISLKQDDLSRESGSFFGKVRANFVGTEFTIYDKGLKPGKKDASEGELRQELAAVTYQYNVLGTRGPRKMMAAIPSVDGTGRRLYHPTSEADCILERIRHRKGLEELVVMGNKPPRWNDELNAYCLNFNGRVTEASVKNFQLVSDDNHNHIILQFGKVGKDSFTMDYQWPISAFQAFAICMSSFDNKLACE